MQKNVLIISQVIPQWYVDLLTRSLGDNVNIDIITGSDVKGNVIKSPKHDPRSFKSRLICWWKHYRFVKKWAKGKKPCDYDLIFAVSNPPVNSRIGLKLKKHFDAPFVYMNWDLYPQVIEKSIKNSVVNLACKVWNSWNSRNYPKIDCMLTIGNVMAQSLNGGLKDPIPVTVIPVAVNTEYLKPLKKEENIFCKDNGLLGRFVVLYSGKMGLGHNIELILETAGLLKDYKDICFVFIGEGPKYKTVEDYISTNNSENVMLFPFQSDDVFPYSMACGDIGIVSQEANMSQLFMPSKTYSMMACGEAIIGIGSDSDDLYRLINEKQIGESVVENSPQTLALKILDLYSDAEKLSLYKNNARKTAEKIYSLEKTEGRYSELFSKFI